MPPDPDRYAVYYAAKLWGLLPAFYRAADGEEGGGTLRELVNRLGAQAAVLRRGIDRLWEDQSVETCDDWAVAYLADLLATNLVASLDARGQRLDVAKTIYYRRRKGTVALLEELAFDVTGWGARVVEFFRRLDRARHGLDPPVGGPAGVPEADALALRRAEGLAGPLTGTPAGGTADLRDRDGATRVGTAFDEFAHTLDVRAGRGQVGWHNIPHLGVFLWPLQTFRVEQATPVPVAACPADPQYTFDPTGRDVPLYAALNRPLGDTWVSPAEWQLPGPLRRGLFARERDNLYDGLDSTGALLRRSVGVYALSGVAYDLVPGDTVTADPHDLNAAFFLDPARGRLVARRQAPAGPLRVSYYYGFSSTLGAGPYDRGPEGDLPAAAPDVPAADGGNALAAALAQAAGNHGTMSVTVGDSLTYQESAPVAGVVTVVVRAAPGQRPVVRLDGTPAAAWTFAGPAAPDGVCTLALDGLYVSGGDLVLQGAFERVLLRCCTLDPGSVGPAGAVVEAADGQPLRPCYLTVEGTVRHLTLDRCITGPIRLRPPAGATAVVEDLTATDSIIQAALPADDALALDEGAVTLTRCTVLGAAQVHRLSASDCVLDGVVTVADPQHGCVRFTAWAEGSQLPRPYRSVAVAAGRPLFASRDVGRPGYARLLEGLDPRIAAGAEDGSEMGAFCREKAPIKERSLLIKYAEYMPVGLTPVLVYVT